MSLALILPLTLVSCGNEELSQQEAVQIVAEAVSATAEVATCKFDLSTAITIERTGGDGPGTMEATIDGTGAVDRDSRQIQISVNAAVATHGTGKREMAMEYYVVDDWLYAKLALTEMGSRWVKTRLTDDIWQAQNQLEQQIELMETATEVRFVGSENVNSTACYVVEIAPSAEELSEFLSRQTVPGTNMNWAEINLEPLFEETFIKLWIAQNSYLLLKSEIDILMEITAEDAGAGEEDFEKLTLATNTQTKLYNYNEAASIELPEQALEAPEIPGR